MSGYKSEAEGYAASLRQMAQWIADGNGHEVDEGELCGAANCLDRLERQLAEADGLISCHANSIDNSHPSTWPKGSLLKAAIERHGQRCAVTNGDG